jgi:serine/threonine-protein kinase
VTVLADRYRLHAQIGEGGMGVVWLARDAELERDVAIKLLRPFVAEDPDQRQRFRREARTLAALANAHIVRVYDYVEAAGQAFLVMEYVDGSNLAETTFGELPLTFAEAAGYGTQIAGALAYAHARGVVHRDLTPANILIERDGGRVVTTDFGLARAARSAGSMTAPGVLIGTPEYWSPEQALGRDTDSAADMYALGCILFLLLSGRLPFEADDRLALGLRRAHEDAPSLRDRVPDAPQPAVDLVDSLLARDPGRRPDAAAAAAVLAAASASTPSAGRMPLRQPPAEKPTVLLPDAATTVTATPQVGPSSSPTVSVARRRRGYGRLAVAFLVAGAVTAGSLFATHELTKSTLRAPDLLALRERAARATVARLLPGSTVRVTAAYSTRVASGRVIRQSPGPHASLRHGTPIRLTVSKGTPFADVPWISVGEPKETARVALARSGFRGRFRYTPSWTVRKGTVIGLRPSAGTRLRRPTTVRIVVASGYPREVVPDVLNADLVSARSRLDAKHLRYRIVFRPTNGVPANRVLRQYPAPGTIVYKWHTVQVTVARSFRWIRVLAQAGGEAFVSDPFTVSGRWRVRYRLTAGDFGLPLVQFSWARNGDLFADGGFIARSVGTLQTQSVSDGAGTYRLAVSPAAGTSWYVEVDALE